MTPPTVLIVEDNPITRKMMRVTLSTAGYSVLEAADGPTALARLADGLDLIIQDLLLPEMDGLTLARRIRAHPMGAHIPLICCSGWLPTMERAEAVQVGFTDYLFKPITPSQLLEAVEAYLPRPEPARNPSGRGRSLLLVDDDPIQRKLGRVHLERAGFRVTTAVDGADALQAARATPPAVILSDVLMPRTDGFALCREVRRDPRLARTPVVLISSAYSEDADRELARLAGAEALVVRTPDFADAIQAVLTCLETPPSAPVPSPEFPTAKYLERVLGQLEHQAALNQSLLHRLALRQAEAAVLTGLAETLRRTNDFRTVLNETLYRCIDAAGVSRALVLLAEPDRQLRLAVSFGFPSKTADTLGDLLGHTELLHRVMTSAKPIELHRHADSPNEEAQLLDRCDAQSALVAPFPLRERCEGVMVLASSHERFGEGWKDFVAVIGVQLGLALGLTRALAESERRRVEAEMLAQLAGKISASLNLDTILQQVAEGAKELCHCEQATIALREPGSEAMRFRYWAGAKYEGYPRLQIESGKGSGGQVLLTGRPFRTDNYAADPRITKDYLASVEANQVVTQLIVPIRSEARIEGLLYAENRSGRPFTDQDEAALLRLATHAAIAIGNVRHRDLLYQTEKLAAMGQLLAGVAHELNNPLSVILGNLALMQPATRSPVEPRIEKIQRAADRCARLVKSFLALARQRPPERRAMRINDTVREAVELLGYQLRVSDVEVILDLDEAVPPIWADPHQFHQVVVNLLTNADQALRTVAAPRTIRVTTRHDPAAGHVRLEVCDSGPGIPPEVQAHVFEPFFTTKPPGEGTGLGLSLCRGIVQEHDGVIHLESDPGRTVFRIELPVGTPGASPPDADLAEPAPEVAARVILVVDDEPEVLDVLSDLLAAAGHRVETAENGAAALERLADHDVDAILSDMRMPGLDGPGLYRALERQKPHLLRRFVFITGDTLSGSTREWLERTGALSLSKPFDLNDVRRVLSRVLPASR
jgi:CheY-like chemotaxis protein